MLSTVPLPAGYLAGRINNDAVHKNLQSFQMYFRTFTVLLFSDLIYVLWSEMSQNFINTIVGIAYNYTLHFSSLSMTM
jgi:hypothetical protein